MGAREADRPVVRLELTLQFSEGSVAGSLSEPGGQRQPFEGWLALLTALSESAPRDRDDQDGR